MELNCKIGGQLLPLFQKMGGRSLQYFIILSRFMSTFLRNDFTLTEQCNQVPMAATNVTRYLVVRAENK